MLIGFCRSIDAYATDAFAARACPSAIVRFPQDLWNPELLFCGLNEDGWISESAWVELAGAGTLRVEGEVPGLGPLNRGQRLTIHVDDRPATTRDLPPGPFSLRIPGLLTGRHRITIVGQTTTTLPAPDGRLVSMQLHSISILPSLSP